MRNITLQPHQTIEIETSGGRIISLGAADAPWQLCGLNIPWEIIAYRITSEPKGLGEYLRAVGIESTTKEEKKCRYCSGHELVAECANCNKGYIKEEPKKQTLLESVSGYSDIDMWTTTEIIEFISKYLEQNKVDK